MRQRTHGRTIRQGSGKKQRTKGGLRKRDRHKARQARKPRRRRGWRSASMRAVARTRQTFRHTPDLCFGKLLPAAVVQEALTRSGLVFRDCFYTPLVTLWTFLCQVLCPDPSCRQAVAHLLAYLAGRGEKGGTSDTGPYCKARDHD